MSANTGSVDINYPTTISYTLPENTLNLINTYASFTSAMIGVSTSVAGGTNCKYLSCRANGTETLRAYNNGNIKNTNNSYGSTSDERLKENITDTKDYTEDFKQIEFKKYNLKTNPDEKHIGVIAQQIEAIFPKLVQTNEDGMKSVEYSILSVITSAVVQQLIKRIENLENKS